MRVSYQWAKRVVVSMLTACGVSEEHANSATAAILDADASGVHSHGLENLEMYVRQIVGGIVDPAPRLLVESDGAVMRIDGGNGLGQVVGCWAIEQAMQRCAANGVVVVAVRRSNHLGALSYYVRMAAEAGYLGFISQTAPPRMALWGGSKGTLGNNPFAVALPAGSAEPLVLDMSCSEVARGRIREAAKNDEPIPLSWALDANGDPTTDPQAALAGTLRAFGGHKGSGIAVVLGALSGVLTGCRYGMDVLPSDSPTTPRDVGHLILLIDLARLMGPSRYSTRMSRYLDQLRGSQAPADGGARLPGDGAAAARQRAAEDGLFVRDGLVPELQTLADELALGDLA